MAMSLLTSANPAIAAVVEARAKSSIVEIKELGSNTGSSTVPDNVSRLGDPFLEDFYSSGLSDRHDFMNEPALSKSQIEILDVCQGSSENEFSCEMKNSSIAGLQVQVSRDCQIRILRSRNSPLSDDYRGFSQQYSVPAAFWDEEGVGSVGQRKYFSETCGCSTDTWLAILQKVWDGDAKSPGFRRVSFLLKQHDSAKRSPLNMPRITLVCFNAPLDLRRRLHHALGLGGTPSPEVVNGVIVDPFRLLLLVIMAWYHWNSRLFWALRNNVFGLEQVNGIRDPGLSRSETPEYAYMHLLATDLIQNVELLEFSLKIIARLKKIHEKAFGSQLCVETTEALEQTAASLDYQFSRFESLEGRAQGLLKRMNNQISLTFHLGQQKAAKTSQGSSDSVKTISILTLLFLPATGIATIFSTPFFRPSDSGFKLDVASSFVFYWILTIPTTLIIMLLWYWWSIKQRPSTDDGALHAKEPIPERKPSIISWRQWATKTEKSGALDVEQRMENDFRPRSPHFWHYKPSWPVPDSGNFKHDMDSDAE